MVDPNSAAPLALLSLGSSCLACLGAAALPALYSLGLLQEPTGVSAGLALLCYGFVSVTLGMLGVAFGVIALRGIRTGARDGRGLAWTGIVLGCLPLVILAGYLTPVLWQGMWDWLGNQGREKQFPI